MSDDCCIEVSLETPDLGLDVSVPTTIEVVLGDSSILVSAEPLEVTGGGSDIEVSVDVVQDIYNFDLGETGPPGPASGAFEVIELLPFIGSGEGSTKTATGINGNIIYEGFGIGDELFVMWTLPLDLDRTKPVSFEGSFFPTGNEVGTDCSWEIHITAHSHVGSELTITEYATDLPLADTAYTHSKGVLVVPTTVLAEEYDALHIMLRRVASSNDPTSNRVGVSDITMRRWRASGT